MSTTPFFTEPVFEPAPDPAEGYGEEDYIAELVEDEFGKAEEVEPIAQQLFIAALAARGVPELYPFGHGADGMSSPGEERFLETASWAFKAAEAFVTSRGWRRIRIEKFKQAERDREPS